MITIQEIKKQRQDSTNKLLNECSVFWAFSDEQFEKNKTPLQPGEKYVSIGAGGYMPQSKVEQLKQGFKDIEKQYREAIKQNKQLRKDNILYELNNHEAFYTGEIEDTLNALGAGYTRKEVLAVFWEKQNELNSN